MIPRRQVGQGFSYTDVVLLAVEGIDALIKQCQEWNLLPIDSQIKCPVSDCPGKLEMCDRVREFDKNIWKCTSMRGESSKKKPIRCTDE